MASGGVFARGLFGVLLAIITFLTLTPDPEEADAGFAVAQWLSSLLFGDAQSADKVAHFGAYGALGLSAYWARIVLFSRRWLIVFLLAVYGVLLEGLQGLGGVRSPELADAIANSAGAICGFLAGMAALRDRTA